MELEIAVILPQKISILRDNKNQDLITDTEEYSIYYKNIIYPYSDDYDIQIDCKVGKNLGHCWRIDSFDGMADTHDFIIKIYSSCGKLLASKSCIIEIYEKMPHKDTTLLCIGDSITQSGVYIHHAMQKMRNIKTIGLRNTDGIVNHEGRGGWTCRKYFDTYEDEGWSVSPFLFPKGYSGRKYFGSKKFWDIVANRDSCGKYIYMGTNVQNIENGMIYLDGGLLWRYEDGIYAEEQKKPEFEFSFAKYMERYGFDKPDIVSLLFGANEFQFCHYEKAEEEIEKYIDSLKK